MVTPDGKGTSVGESELRVFVAALSCRHSKGRRTIAVIVPFTVIEMIT